MVAGFNGPTEYKIAGAVLPRPWQAPLGLLNQDHLANASGLGMLRVKARAGATASRLRALTEVAPEVPPNPLSSLASPAGLEPATHSLGNNKMLFRVYQGNLSQQ
jgi:hypothetical protein